ncbi:MAG TPA: sensor histidine kinase N-terminal domain-containing protein [Eoetvoesiella sp.]
MLLWSIIPALIVILVIALWISNHQLRTQVNIAYDRSLAGALRSIDHNISTASGGLSLEQPYLLLEFFELTANERVYFRVLTEDGLAEIGNQELPLPSAPLISGVPQFYNAIYLGQSIRIAALARPMNPPLNKEIGGRVIVQVAEDFDTREQFIHSMLLRSIERDVVVVGLVILIVVLGVLFAVRPLTRLHNDLAGRRFDDLRPVEDKDIPSEVQPLVAAVNSHMARYAKQARMQRQFLNDASHQLRTPFSVLRAQLGYALREDDPEEIHSALQAMREGLDRAVRTTNQMLSLARAREGSPLEMTQSLEKIDLTALAHGILKDMYPVARTKQLDFGFEGPDLPVRIDGFEWLIREAIINLVDNAIRYTPVGGIVTLRSYKQGTNAYLIVEDNGPGMTPADIEKAGIRFRRGAAGKNTTGAGLGLAIVRTIMKQHQGEFTLETLNDQKGCRATLVFTLDFADKARV